jgi:hypothetical protein
METEEMTSLRLPGGLAVACACVLVAAGFSAAAAQMLPMPGQSAPASQFPPAPGQSGAFPPPTGQSGSQSRQASPFPPAPGQSAPQGGRQAGPVPPAGDRGICGKFVSIRSAVEKGGEAIQAAGKRKASREEVCPLFKRFAVREARMVKFLVDNQSNCGVPDQAIKIARTNHAKTLQIRNQVCNAAPAAPTGPTLSDALGGPIIADDTSAKQPGRGTFDTLTGNVLSR